MQNMTVTTRAMYQAATSGNLSVQEAVRLLRQEMKPRTLVENLQRFAKGRELRPLLAEGLKRNHPDKKPESMDRKVRDWFGGKDRALRKEDALEVCFILGLTAEEAEELLMLLTGEGFHWRSPEEIVFIYALQKGLDYPAACALNERMQPYLAAVPASDKPDAFTAVMRREVSSLQDEAQLAEYLSRAAAQLGRFHNTAYSLFMEYMTLLEEGSVADLLEDASAMTTREVVEAYFHRRFVPPTKGDKANAAMSAIQRSIQAAWPDEVAISRMKNRAADVTRKVMILLFIATDGGDADDDLLDDWEETSVFEDAYARLNDMLTLCGFSPLDPRAPFDWMMLYCLCVEDIFDVDAQMTAFLQTLFSAGDA